MDEMTPPPQDQDNEALMDHCAQECIDAVEKKDKKAFVESLNVLIADILTRMSSPEPKE